MTLLRVCSCGHLIAATKRRCEACARADSQRRNTRTKRDGRNTTQWTKTRAAVLNRDDHTCQHCGAHATGVHRVHGGHHTTNLDDYQALCAPCHGRTDRARQHNHPGGAPIPPKNPQPPKPPTSFRRTETDPLVF